MCVCVSVCVSVFALVIFRSLQRRCRANFANSIARSRVSCVCVCVCGFRVLGFVVLGFWGFRFFLIVAAARHVTTKIQQRNKKKPNKQKQNQRNNRLQKIVAPGTKIHSVFFSVHYDMLNE